MKRIATALILAATMLLILPVNSSLTNAPLPVNTIGQPQEPEIKFSESIYTTCPALAEIPLMLGRPAPCIVSYKISGD